MSSAFSEKTLHDLEWHRIVRAIADRCVGPSREMAQLALATDERETHAFLAQSHEAFLQLQAGDPIPLEGLKDIRASLQRLERGGALESFALLDLATVIGAARNLRRFLGTRRKTMPELFDACGSDPTLDGLESELRAAIDVDGVLFDSASPELARLRVEVANLRDRILGRLEEIIQKRADLLSDRYFTLRDGRYVLPVRTDAHERFPGIVHGSSASGATVFVEPRPVVALGNRLKVAQGELDREVERLLGLLSDLAREKVPELHAAFDALNIADLRHACARFGVDMRATFPAPVKDARISLISGRHPILALDGVAVIGNDMSIAAGQALVLSGPNAGGKTVALKTLGLAALMVRAGLPLLADDGSEIGFFDTVLSDVGDDQSLSKNLSTFSAHITNLAEILKIAGPRTLVLLDELAGGTDPEEGAALACAVVDALCKRGAALGVTTHYEALKALALRDSRLRNASVGFDVKAMLPTFHLMMDVPGASSALAVATRFGIPEDVIAVARRVLPEHAKNFDVLVQKLEEEWRALAISRATQEELSKNAAHLRGQLDAELAEMRSRGKNLVERESEALAAEIRRAREEVRTARQRAKQRKIDDSELTEISRAVDIVASKAALGGDLEPPTSKASEAKIDAAPIDGNTIRVGQRLYATKLRSEVDVIEPLQKGRVRVAAGPMKVWVELRDLRQIKSVVSDEKKPSKDGAPSLLAQGIATVPLAYDGNTLDLRGLRVDDALSLLETFLDRLYGASINVGYILHGYGTGALKEAVRERLNDQAHYVAHHRSALPEEGGDKFTLVFLR